MGTTDGTNFRAPVGCLDIDAFDEDGDAYEIHACASSVPSHAAVVVQDDGTIRVRERHAVECMDFQVMISAVASLSPKALRLQPVLMDSQDSG
jgi:hypothetical protein